MLKQKVKKHIQNQIIVNNIMQIKMTRTKPIRNNTKLNRVNFHKETLALMGAQGNTISKERNIQRLQLNWMKERINKIININWNKLIQHLVITKMLTQNAVSNNFTIKNEINN